MEIIVVLLLVATVVLAVARLIYVLHSIHQGLPLVLSHHKTVKTLVVLGSGGHTVEMLKMVAALDPKKYNPRIYVMADTDKISNKKLSEVEKHFKVRLFCKFIINKNQTSIISGSSVCSQHNLNY